jgi:hypothetical protein
LRLFMQTQSHAAGDLMIAAPSFMWGSAACSSSSSSSSYSCNEK